MGYPESRLRQAIMYVAWLTREDEKFGSTKLNKALFWADFRSYFHHGRAVTQERYQALEDGPTLVAMKPTLGVMCAAGEVQLVRPPAGEIGEHRVIPRAYKRPATPLLDAQDLEQLEAGVTRVRSLTAEQVSLSSHDFPGWGHAWLQGSGTPIPYESVFWGRRDELTDADEAWARGVAERHPVRQPSS
jgi:hypothetical protein